MTRACDLELYKHGLSLGIIKTYCAYALGNFRVRACVLFMDDRFASRAGDCLLRLHSWLGSEGKAHELPFKMRTIQHHRLTPNHVIEIIQNSDAWPVVKHFHENGALLSSLEFCYPYRQHERRVMVPSNFRPDNKLCRFCKLYYIIIVPIGFIFIRHWNSYISKVLAKFNARRRLNPTYLNPAFFSSPSPIKTQFQNSCCSDQLRSDIEHLIQTSRNTCSTIRTQISLLPPHSINCRSSFLP